MELGAQVLSRFMQPGAQVALFGCAPSSEDNAYIFFNVDADEIPVSFKDDFMPPLRYNNSEEFSAGLWAQMQRARHLGREGKFYMANVEEDTEGKMVNAKLKEIVELIKVTNLMSERVALDICASFTQASIKTKI